MRVHPLPMTRDQVDQEERIVSMEDQPLKILAALQKLYQHPALLRAESEVTLEPSSTLAASPKLAKCIEIPSGRARCWGKGHRIHSLDGDAGAAGNHAASRL